VIYNFILSSNDIRIYKQFIIYQKPGLMWQIWLNKIINGCNSHNTEVMGSSIRKYSEYRLFISIKIASKYLLILVGVGIFKHLSIWNFSILK